MNHGAHGGRGRRAGPRGFTLIEALISSVLLVTMLLFVGDIQRSARMILERVRTQTGLESTDSTVSDAVLARGYGVFQSDCRHFQNPAFLPKGEPTIDLTSVTGDTTDGKISFYVAEYQPAGAEDIRKVTYSIEEGGLTRTSDPPSSASTHLERRQEVLVPGAASLKIALSDGEQYMESWEGRLGLPRGLKLSFTVTGHEDQAWARPFGGPLE